MANRDLTCDSESGPMVAPSPAFLEEALIPSLPAFGLSEPLAVTLLSPSLGLSRNYGHMDHVSCSVPVGHLSWSKS